MNCAWWVRDETHRLFTVVNSPAGEPTGSALLLPPFGAHLHNMFAPAFCLNRADVRTVRFDNRNNLGASAGEIADYKFGVLLEDARFAAQRMVELFGSDDFFIFGTSMSAPAAIALALEYPKARVFLLVPIIDIGRVVNLVSGNRGAMDAYRRRSPDIPGTRTILGHDIHLQDFVDELVGTQMGTAEEVLAGARSLRGRIDIVVSEKDEYATPELQRRLLEAVGSSEDAIVLEGTGHDLSLAPEAAKRAFAHLVRSVQSHFGVPEAKRGDRVPQDATRAAAARFDRKVITDFCSGHRVESGIIEDAPVPRHGGLMADAAD